MRLGCYQKIQQRGNDIKKKINKVYTCTKRNKWSRQIFFVSKLRQSNIDYCITDGTLLKAELNMKCAWSFFCTLWTICIIEILIHGSLGLRINHTRNVHGNSCNYSILPVFVGFPFLEYVSQILKKIGSSCHRRFFSVVLTKNK